MRKPESTPHQQYLYFVTDLKKKYPGSVVLSLPLPPAGVTAHNEGHRMIKSSIIKKYRSETELEVKALKLAQISKKVKIHHVWFCHKSNYEVAAGKNCKKKYKHYRPLDEGNAIQALKPLVDGLVDAGLLKGDTWKEVTWGDYLRLGTEKQNFGKCGLLLFLEVLP
jgi:hypothetical protein